MSLSRHNPTSFGGLLESRAITNPNSVGSKAQQHSLPPATRRNEWIFRPGSYTPREFVREIAILPESVIVQLGPDGPGEADSRAILMDGLRSSLSHEGREATLLLDDWDSEEPSDLTRHILRIGETLFNYASEANHSVPGDPSLTVYSPCEGHKWVPPAGRLLRSHRSSPILMMLYNEWLHQLTCLRDFLIAFDNIEDVVLNLANPSRRGTRPMEDVREVLLEQVRSGQASREILLETAKVLTGPDLLAGGYGFQFSNGVVLPAAVFSGTTSSLLLRYSPTLLIQEQQQRPVLFESTPGSSSAGETQIGDLGAALSSTSSKVYGGWTSIALETERNPEAEQNEYVLKLAVTSEEKDSGFSIDLARVIQGLDAATNASSAEERDILAASSGDSIHGALAILGEGKGVVTNPSANPAVVRVTDEVELLALLGKLAPRGVRLGGQWKRGNAKQLNTNRGSSEPGGFLII